MNRKIILIVALIFLFAAAEAAIFIVLAVNFGFVAILFAYMLKSIIGYTAAHFLLERSHPDISRRMKFQDALTLDEAWRKKATLAAISVALPGILTTIVALVLSFSARLRQALIAKIMGEIQKSVIENMMGAMSGGKPGGVPFEDLSSMLGGSPFGAAPSGASPQRESFEDVYDGDGTEGVWQTENRTQADPKSKEENAGPVVVDISS